jgi:signal peptidase I
MAVTAILAPPLRRSGLARVEHFTSNVVWVFLALFVLGIGGLAVYTHTGHGAFTPVLSGSMQPGIQAGDVVVTNRVPVTSLHVGDIIVFIPPDRPRPGSIESPR